ncbi:hypothetical protein [Pantoea sp.]|uniref:hypothetical protein n=1 Tax=Pantoea sp. TaxID=69393 RepID=UPI0028AFFE16|nr:hypothetical protein [Pantoea sp.]
MASSQTTEIKKVIILAGIGGIKMPWHNEDMNGIHETCVINHAATDHRLASMSALD